MYHYVENLHLKTGGYSLKKHRWCPKTFRHWAMSNILTAVCEINILSEIQGG